MVSIPVTCIPIQTIGRKGTIWKILTPTFVTFTTCFPPKRFPESSGARGRMKRRDLVAKLEEVGCVLLRHGAKHDIYHNPKIGKSEPVPRHARSMSFVYLEAGASCSFPYNPLDDHPVQWS